MGYDPNDPKQVAEARKKAEKAQALHDEVIKNIMATPAGRGWFYEILSWCHIFTTTFIQGSPDASAWQEGMRNVGLRILADIQRAAPELYLQMVREAKE